MFRRRRRATREIPFSFDSFLDIVANVVGVIIRLILVVWVGARSYGSLKEMAQPRAEEVPAATVQELSDPLQQEIGRHKLEVARLQAELLAHLRQVEVAAEERARTQHALTALTARRQSAEHETGALREGVSQQGRTTEAAALTLTELRQRQERLREELRRLEQAPVARKALRYRTPVSQPVHAEQLMFELRHDRITFVDIAALLAEVRQGLEEKSRQLRAIRQVQAVAGPVGAFRLLYTLERERGALDSLGAPAETETQFRYGLSEWRIDPVQAQRGETAEQALAEHSAFRQIVDALDSRQAVVTIWVYPDSFTAYRRLRDYLHDHEIVVAGRPLSEDAPIAASPRGSVSRGQ